MRSVEQKLRALLVLAQTVLDDIPFGLLVLSARGNALWHNKEAEVVCAVWNDSALRQDALPLQRGNFEVPQIFRKECALILAEWSKTGATPEPRVVGEPERGLHALIRLQPRPQHRKGPPAFCVQLDYRRPRGDRDRPLSPSALSLMNMLSFREREVALRIRDGLTTQQIAAELRRSPLTIKTQLAGIFRKLGVDNRSRVAAMLNR